MGEYEKARHDLSASQQMDYDDGAAEDLKFVMKKVKEIEGEKVKRKVEEEDRLRKKSDDIRKAREEAKREAEDAKNGNYGEYQETNEAEDAANDWAKREDVVA